MKHLKTELGDRWIASSHRKTESNVGVEKILFLFRGPCGCGKSFVRKQMKMPTVGIDMGDADLRHLPVEDRVRYPALFVRGHKNQLALWMEGIFAPDSPSMIALAAECREQGRIIQHIVAFTDKDTARMRIAVTTPPADHASRQSLADRYHIPFARAIGQ